MQLRFLAIILGIFLIIGCSPKQSDFIIAKFNGQEITIENFKNEFDRNLPKGEDEVRDTLKDAKNFLDLYTLYKIKLKKAYDKGYHNDGDIIKEYEDYKFATGKNYIIAKELEEVKVKEIYESRKFEYRISHIQINIDTTRSEDEAKVLFNNIQSYIKSGQPWAELVNKYSDDPNGSLNAGDLYFVTPGTLLPSFEKAILATTIGEVHSEPVRSRMGIHILKVTDKVNRKPSVRVKHILLRGAEKDMQPDYEKAKEVADKLMAEIEAGANFDSLAVNYSEDENSAKRYGDIGFVKRNTTVRPFDETVFTTPLGEVAGPIKTAYGYHILKVTEIEELESFEQEAPMIRDFYKKSRLQDDLNQLVDGLEVKYGLKLTEGTQKNILDQVAGLSYQEISDSSFILNKIKDVELLSIGEEKFNFAGLLDNKTKNNKLNDRLTESTLIKDVSTYAGDELFRIEVDKLIKNNSEFGRLMNDYLNGLYIFKLQEEEVWNKVSFSDEDVKKYYELNKNDFQWKERLSYMEISSYSKKMIDSCFAMLRDGLEPDSVESMFGKVKRGSVLVQTHDLQEIKNLDDHNKVKDFKVGQFTHPFRKSRKYTILVLLEKINTCVKTFEEAEGEVSSKLQEIYTIAEEEKFEKQLMEEYTPEIFYEKLEQIFHK